MQQTDAMQQIQAQNGVLATHKVLRNTYALLAMTVLFSAVAAVAATAMRLPHPGLLLTLAGCFGLLFAVYRLRNSAWGLLAVFALTGFMGLTLGPLFSAYLALPNGSQIIAMSLGGTGTLFLALSSYVLLTRRDFTFLGGFLLAGIIAGFIAALGAVFFDLPALSMTISAIFILLMAGLILYETSNIIQGGETNYIMATVTLYVALFNLLSSLMHLLGVFGSDE
ncbi:MAG: Bax inhibitor-1/YccA family protein [Pseudomonadota bacterium]